VRVAAVALALIALALVLVRGSRFEVRTPHITSHAAPRTPNLSAAGVYLDHRASWWTAWPAAQREHGTVCVSCHTTLPYVLARSAVDAPASAVETRVIDSVISRLRAGATVAPYYANRSGDDRKEVESRGTEAVLNALILANHDARAATRPGVMGADTQLAFDRLWALQRPDGGWPWLRFDLDPWEGPESEYFGAALAALAVGAAPATYRSMPGIASNITRLRSFLSANYARQPLANRAALLWAATAFPDAIDVERRSALVEELVHAQRNDGGWSLAFLQSNSLRTRFASSDGYATGLAVLALRTTAARAAADRGRAWLTGHQDPECACWHALSLNAKRDPASDPALFMTDAATAFAVMALATSDGSTQTGYVR